MRGQTGRSLFRAVRRPSAAEAGFHSWRRLAARLKAVPFPVKVKGRVKSNGNVKGVGQECPTHMVYLWTRKPRSLALLGMRNLGVVANRHPV
jgi:hypothetical protein